MIRTRTRAGSRMAKAITDATSVKQNDLRRNVYPPYALISYRIMDSTNLLCQEDSRKGWRPMNQPSVPTFSEIQQMLINLLANTLFHARLPLASQADWPAVLRESVHQAVFSQVYQEAKQLLSPPERRAWETRYFQTLAKNLNVIHAHHQVHELLTDAGVPYVIMKGCASARCYALPTERMMGDIDVYIFKEDLSRVDRLLRQRGYDYLEDHLNHRVYRKDGIETEVHWTVTGIPTADNETILPCFADLIETGTVIEVCDQTMRLPDEYHHGLIILLHMISHLTADGIGLRHLLDWLVFQSSMPEERFLACFEQTLKQIRLWQFTKVITAVGVHYFACPTRNFCTDVSRSLTAELLLDIFEGGNFGQKDKDRLNQSKLLRDNETKRVDGSSRLRNALGFLNQRARAAMPAAEKTPLLLPIGWIRVFGKWRRDVKAGKQPKLRLRKTMIGAKKRQSLYEQLKLFEE